MKMDLATMRRDCPRYKWSHAATIDEMTDLSGYDSWLAVLLAMEEMKVLASMHANSHCIGEVIERS